MSSYAGPYPGNEMFQSFTKTWHSKPYPSVSPSRPELSASGKVIFITGGGSGIGKATAIAFAQAGAKIVAIFGRRVNVLESAAEEIRSASLSVEGKGKGTGETIVAYESVDITKMGELENAFKSALRKAGAEKVDVIVNNAGVLRPPHALVGYPRFDLDAMIQGNLIGSFNVIQAVSPLLTPDAKVLNISSGIAHIDPVASVWAYAGLKLGIVKMFEYLQAENPGWSVFNVQPGVVETELNVVSGFPGQDDVNLPGQFHVWLASPEAEFLKGKFVWVNWDVDELKSLAKEIEGSALLRIGLNGYYSPSQ